MEKTPMEKFEERLSRLWKCFDFQKNTEKDPTHLRRLAGHLNPSVFLT